MRESFSVFECSIARRATGRVCTNLRELLEAVRTMPDAVLEHHTIHCALEDHFELHEFPNDLAHWCWSTLGDNVLGEQLGLIDPYLLTSTVALRETIANLIEDRLWHLERVPWCRPGYRIAPGRIAADRLRHRRANRHADGTVGCHRADDAAVPVLSRA